MAFPDDLADVVAFKIHPAIGCARLASNEDYYEFFDYEEKRKTAGPQSVKYMSLRNGKHWIMRQAVRFRIFAYGADGREIGELTGDVMTRLGLRATWTANVANRKLNVWSQGATPAVEAQASATAGESKRLEGNNPWRPGKVWLGDITGDGLFIPPMGGAYRKTANTSIPPYGNHRKDNGILDTTSDGSINVSLAGANNIPVVPACVIVAPQDHSPDVGPGQINNFQNKDFVQQTRTLLNIPQNASLSGVGYAMDLAMMKTMNADYNPGMEICLDGGPALTNPAGAFFPRGQQHINANEIRPSYATTRPGQLTAGLCSAWQTDLSACLNYWTSTYPDELTFDTAPETRVLARQQFAANGPRINNPDWLNANIDMMEIGRDVENDINDLHGTERDANDNAGNVPVAPFPLEAEKLPPETS
ncbi:LodA/GoxA family CTQ-dependent oxidase [Bradyrhizobium sp. CB82]|uniref:LodA/GoxA family CTQ-dependent oxidase n=1 Tax=Bradyrhizobium sp. CB82 TaxID=3039159 RepID=UPI0024B03FAF|nr:LodA/GoxA family CTQ-dependent oxidase [Bradyrhizobium sp. CB82]WFU44159.1 LodA/GoxA family CTQ-dependent oxidase [Bradyrhizobium sp. CB82]